MVWSDSIGSSITVPSDKNVSDPTDTRDWINIGADVPVELASWLSAGIFFYNGAYVAGSTSQQAKYYGIGAKSQAFFSFVYIENYKGVAGDHHFIEMNTTTLFSNGLFQLGMGANDQGILSNAASLQVSTRLYGAPITVFGSGISGKYVDVGSRGLYAAAAVNPGGVTFTDYDRSGTYNWLKVYINADGDLRVVGLVKNNLAIAASTAYTICSLSGANELVGWFPNSAVVCSATVNGTSIARVDIRPNGDVAWSFVNPAFAAGTYISLNLTVPTGSLSA